MADMQMIYCRSGNHLLRRQYEKNTKRGKTILVWQSTENHHKHHLGMDNKGFMQWSDVCRVCRDDAGQECETYLEAQDG